MKQLILIFILFAFNESFIFCQNNSFHIEVGNGGNNEINFVKICANNDIVVTGNTDTLLTIGSVQLNRPGGFVARFDSLGNILWLLPAGTGMVGFSGLPEIRYPGLAIDDSNNTYVFGSFNDTAFVGSTYIVAAGANNTFLSKIDSAGNIIWLKNIASNNVAYDAAVDAFGNIVVTGYFNNTAMFDTVSVTPAGTCDMFLARYDNSGQLIWVKQAGGSGFYSDAGYAIDIDGAGNIYVGGHIRSDASFDNLTLVSHGISGFDGFIAKYNSSGNCQWVKYCGYECHAVAVDSIGNCYTGGYMYSLGYFDTLQVANSGGSSGLFIARINSTGNYEWVRINETNDFSWTVGLAADNSGNCYASGLYRGILTISSIDSVQLQSSLCLPAGNEVNTFIVCLDTTGNPKLGKTFQSCGSGSMGSQIDANDCRIVATGMLRYPPNPIYFDSDSMLINGVTNGYIVAYDTCLLSTDIQKGITQFFSGTIFPNPVNEFVRLNYSDNYIGKINIRIIENSGKTVKHFTDFKGGLQIEIILDVKELESGFYIMNIQSDRREYNLKFLR
jgi:hypothetical protein